MMVRLAFPACLGRWEQEAFPEPEGLLGFQDLQEYQERREVLVLKEMKVLLVLLDQLECQEIKVPSVRLDLSDL
jgi:hypothetical protein